MTTTPRQKPIPPVLTTEQRRKGALNRAAKVREEKKTFRQRLAEKLDEQADELIAVAISAGKNGDWRAMIALVEQVYGKPKETVEVSGGLQLQAGVDSWLGLSIEELVAKRAEVYGRLQALEQDAGAVVVDGEWSESPVEPQGELEPGGEPS